MAKHMTTKTHIMVKNYYHRQVDSGNGKEWENIAKEADEKKERGESMGSPPDPTIFAKRRYDGTPGSVPRAGSAMEGLDDLPASGQSTFLPQNSPPQPPSLQSTRFPPLLPAGSGAKNS
jgi:hypothetical protein